MNTKISVSIIIPVFNSEKYILRTLESLFSNFSESFEYIFIDDASSDLSLPILKNYLITNKIPTENIKIKSLEVNSGSSCSRNEGLSIATGEYIGFLDADDWITADAFSQMFNFASLKDYDIIWTNFYYSDGINHRILYQKFVPNTQECIKMLLREKMHGALWNKLYKRNLFIQNNIRFPERQDYWEDLSTNVLLFSKSDKVGFLNESFYYYYQNNKTSLGSRSLQIKLSQILFNTNRVITYLSTNYGDLYKEDFNYLKLAAKQSLLFTTDIANFYEWEGIYRESNQYILKFTPLPIHLRILGWCCAKRQWWLAHLYVNIKKIVR